MVNYRSSNLGQADQCEEQDMGEGKVNSREEKFKEGKVDMGVHQNEEKETISRPTPILTESVSALADNQLD